MTELAKHGGTPHGKRGASTNINFEPIDYSGLTIAAHVSTGSHIDGEGKNETGSPLLNPRVSFLKLLGPEHDLSYSQAKSVAAKYLETLRRHLIEQSEGLGGLEIGNEVKFADRDTFDAFGTAAGIPTVASLGGVKFKDLSSSGLAALSDNERMAVLGAIFEKAHAATAHELGEAIAFEPAPQPNTFVGRVNREKEPGMQIDG
jgi:hypothetical protein